MQPHPSHLLLVSSHLLPPSQPPSVPEHQLAPLVLQESLQQVLAEVQLALAQRQPRGHLSLSASL